MSLPPGEDHSCHRCRFYRYGDPKDCSYFCLNPKADYLFDSEKKAGKMSNGYVWAPHVTNACSGFSR
jgi:hypothetical protein